jgi:hypothetical protein
VLLFCYGFIVENNPEDEVELCDAWKILQRDFPPLQSCDPSTLSKSEVCRSSLPRARRERDGRRVCVRERAMRCRESALCVRRARGFVRPLLLLLHRERGEI